MPRRPPKSPGDRQGDSAGKPAGPDEPANQTPIDGAADDELSPRARDIKAQIEAGTYEVDLDGLADSLVCSGDLDSVEAVPLGAQPANDEHVEPAAGEDGSDREG